MIVYAVAVAQALFYILCMPVHVAVRCDGLRFAVGLSLFDRRAARSKAAENLSRHRPRRKRGGTNWRVLARLRFRRVALSGAFALGDAALTALALGALNALVGALSGRADHVRLDVRPDFAANALNVELRGMLTLRAGQIIRAALPI